MKKKRILYRSNQTILLSVPEHSLSSLLFMFSHSLFSLFSLCSISPSLSLYFCLLTSCSLFSLIYLSSLLASKLAIFSLFPLSLSLCLSVCLSVSLSLSLSLSLFFPILFMFSSPFHYFVSSSCILSSHSLSLSLSVYIYIYLFSFLSLSLCLCLSVSPPPPLSLSLSDPVDSWTYIINSNRVNLSQMKNWRMIYLFYVLIRLLYNRKKGIPVYRCD